MSLFAKQSDRPMVMEPAQGAYRITDLIRLLKTIPIEQHPDLVLQVIRTTLESVGVQSSSVIEDANFRENAIREEVAMLEDQIIVLAQEVQARRDQIAHLHAELAETLDARNRLAGAEIGPNGAQSIDLSLPQLAEPPVLTAEAGGILPPPLPPPRRRNGSDRAPARLPDR